MRTKTSRNSAHVAELDMISLFSCHMVTASAYLRSVQKPWSPAFSPPGSQGPQRGWASVVVSTSEEWTLEGRIGGSDVGGSDLGGLELGGSHLVRTFGGVQHWWFGPQGLALVARTLVSDSGDSNLEGSDLSQADLGRKLMRRTSVVPTW
eukprot:gene15771-biopygen4392